MQRYHVRATITLYCECSKEGFTGRRDTEMNGARINSAKGRVETRSARFNPPFVGKAIEQAGGVEGWEGAIYGVARLPIYLYTGIN